MKLIIDIPEDVYTRLFDNGIQDNEIATDDICEMARALRLGTPLPKGHGRLIDAEVFSHNVVKYSHQSTKTIGQALADTPTIIEADTKSDEQEKVDDYRDILDELEREEYYESKYGKEQE